jgi:hypothetical protein
MDEQGRCRAMDLCKAWPCSEGSAIDKQPHQIQLLIPNRPRSRARNPGPSPSPSTRANARPPQPRGSGPAFHPQITGPRAAGGGGWPMQATAQPWHAEGLPSSTGATVSEVPSSLATTSTSLVVAANQSLQPRQTSPPGERTPGYWAPSMACFWLAADPASINGNLSPKPRSVAMGDCSFYGISLAQEPGHQY